MGVGGQDRWIRGGLGEGVRWRRWGGGGVGYGIEVKVCIGASLRFGRKTSFRPTKVDSAGKRGFRGSMVEVGPRREPIEHVVD